jgi:hypothetical protein
MEKQPRLTCIEISYKDSTNEPPNDFLRKKDFIDSLTNKPLSSINAIHVGYELHLIIEQDDFHNKWKVMKDAVFFFSFTCDNERGFIDIFEEKLKKKLCERNDPLENDAKISMGGE